MVGFSDKINDPMYENYRKKTRKWSFLFATILAVVTIVGFVVYGEMSGQIEMPHSLFYGLGIGALFIVIALLQEVKRKTDTTWDGVVVDKQILQKIERVRYGNKGENCSLRVVRAQGQAGRWQDLHAQRTRQPRHFRLLPDRREDQTPQRLFLLRKVRQMERFLDSHKAVRSQTAAVRPN